MVYRKIVIGVLAGLVWAASAQAQEARGTVTSETVTSSKSYVATVPFYHSPDDDRGADDGLGIQLTYGHLLTGRLYLEGTISSANLETGTNGGTDFYQTTLGLDLAYYFLDPAGFSPFILAGGGAADNDVFPDSQDDTTFYANAGLGFVSGELGNSGLRLRGDARYIYDDFIDGMGDWRVGLGLQVPLGQTRTVVREVPVEVPVVKEVVKEVPMGPADSDGDGVVDGVDRCPNTLKGAQVDQYGCVVKKQTVKLEGVHFEFDSARLTSSSLTTLQGVAQSLNSQPDIRVEIAGHTDWTGPETYNRNLSQQRAESVYKYLISQGVSADRMTPRGYGESQPVASNETRQGRALNRRVEFRIAGRK